MRRAGAGLQALLALVLVLNLAGCTDGSGGRSLPGRCHGVTARDVVGTPPSYAGRRLARFDNDSAMCRGYWLPTADRWFVPQGLALDGDTAWVSGYRWRAGYGDRPCRLLRVSLRTGRLLASTDRLQADVYGGHLTFCRHGGALVQDRHGLWVAESNRLWLVDPARVGRADQVLRVWRLQAPVWGSVLVGGSPSGLGLTRWRDGGRGRTQWFRPADVLAPGVTALVAGRRPRPDEAAAVRSAPAVRRVQGAARGPAGRRGLWSTASVTRCGMMVTPGGHRIGFLPGAEQVAFDRRGGLWVVSESASRNYQRLGRPLVPMLARFDLAQLLRGAPEDCSW